VFIIPYRRGFKDDRVSSRRSQVLGHGSYNIPAFIGMLLEEERIAVMTDSERALVS